MLDFIKCYNHRVQIEQVLKRFRSNLKISKYKHKKIHREDDGVLLDVIYTKHTMTVSEFIDDVNIDIMMSHSSCRRTVRTSPGAKTASIAYSKARRIKGSESIDECSEYDTIIKIDHKIWKFDFIIDADSIIDTLYKIVQCYKGKLVNIDPKPASHFEEIVSSEAEKKYEEVLPGIAGVFASYSKANKIDTKVSSFW